MTVREIEKECKVVEMVHINIGETFLFGSTLYMRIGGVLSDNNEINAVCLESGFVAQFKREELVIEASATIIYSKVRE